MVILTIEFSMFFGNFHYKWKSKARLQCGDKDICFVEFWSSFKLYVDKFHLIPHTYMRLLTEPSLVFVIMEFETFSINLILFGSLSHRILCGGEAEVVCLPFRVLGFYGKSNEISNPWFSNQKEILCIFCSLFQVRMQSRIQ